MKISSAAQKHLRSFPLRHGQAAVCFDQGTDGPVNDNWFFVSPRVKEHQAGLVKVETRLEDLHGSMDIANTLGADNMGKLQLWVDDAYAVRMA
jgi:hypothetical protein